MSNYKDFTGEYLTCGAGEYVVEVIHHQDYSNNKGSVCYRCSGGPKQYLCHGNIDDNGAKDGPAVIRGAVPMYTSCPDGKYVQGIDLDPSPAGGIMSKINMVCNNGFMYGNRNIDPKKICETGIMSGVQLIAGPNYAKSVSPICATPPSNIPVWHKPTDNKSDSGMSDAVVWIIIICVVCGVAFAVFVIHKLYSTRELQPNQQEVNPAPEGQQ